LTDPGPPKRCFKVNIAATNTQVHTSIQPTNQPNKQTKTLTPHKCVKIFAIQPQFIF
jgi:hypothetical protein